MCPGPTQTKDEAEANTAFGGRISGESYGWVVAVAGCFGILSINNFQYSFGVFLKPLINQFGWSRAAISGCVTIRSILSGVLSPISGSLSDRYGPRKLVTMGVFLVGTSYLLASQISSLWQLYLILGLITGLGTGCASTPIVATATKWFGGRAAFANGIVMSGFGLAQILVPPLATYFILRDGWETTFIILGLGVFVVGAAARGFIKNPPQGKKIPTADRYAGKATLRKVDRQPPAPVEYSVSEALHTPTLWIMFLIYLTVALCYQMTVIHIVAAAMDEGATLEAATLILTLSGITNTLGRLVIGGLANKLGTKLVIALCLLIQAPALFSLAVVSKVYLFYIICTVYGFAHAGVIPLMPTMAASVFGTKSVGSIFGFLNLGYTAGVATGPLLAGVIFDVTGSYSPAFLSAAVAMVIIFFLSLFLKRPGPKAPG